MGGNFPTESFLQESLRQLHQLQMEGVLCDVRIFGKERREFTHVHKCVLASQSTYFKAMFTSNMQECSKDTIVFENMTDVTTKKLVEWCYTGHIHLTSDDVEDILDGAHMLGKFEVLIILSWHRRLGTDILVKAYT